MLQVSRPSVREALRGLQILGVVKTRQGGGAYISSLDAADLLGPLQILITLNEDNVEAPLRGSGDGRRPHRAARGRTSAATPTSIACSPSSRCRRGSSTIRSASASPTSSSTGRSWTGRATRSCPRAPIPSTCSASSTAASHRDLPGVLSQSPPTTPTSSRRWPRATPTAAERATETHMRNVHLSTREAMERAK